MKFIKIFLIFLSILTIPLINCFKSLEELIFFTSISPEYPDPDNNDVVNPDYTSLYKKQTYHFWKYLYPSQKILSLPVNELNQNLKNITRYYLSQGLLERYVIVLKILPGTQFLIFSNIQSEIHSLARMLAELYYNKIIDRKFKIIAKNVYLIFNSSIGTNSPYALETLSLIVQILLTNPDSAFYIKGFYEDKENWTSKSLSRQIYIQDTKNKFIVDLFFKTLPLGIYILSENAFEPPIRLSAYNINAKEFNHLACKVISPKNLPSEKGRAICKLGDVVSFPQGSLTALITTGFKNIQSYNMHGLQFIKSNPPTWDASSSPTMLYRKKFGFFYDSFFVLTIAKSLNASTITLFTQSTYNLGFKIENTFKLINGNVVQGLPKYLKWSDTLLSLQSILTKQSNTTNISSYFPVKTTASHAALKGKLEIGSTLDVSGRLKNIGLATRSGISLAVNKINREGGINGKQYIVNFLNDNYNPDLSRFDVKKLIASNIKFILAPSGTPTLFAWLDLIRDKKIFVLFPTSGSPEIRKTHLTNIVHFRQSYFSESKVLTYHMLKKLPSKKLAFFYQDDDYGKSALAGAIKILKKEGIKKWIEVPFQATGIFIKEAVNLIKRENPDAIGLFSNIAPTMEFIRQLGADFLANKRLFALSPLGDTSFKFFIKSVGVDITFSQVVPNPITSTIDIVKEYREQAAKQGVVADTYTLESYIATSLAAHYFKKIEKSINFKVFSKLVTNTKNYNFKGLKLNFNPKTHELNDYLWIEQSNGKWIKYDTRRFSI